MTHSRAHDQPAEPADGAEAADGAEPPAASLTRREFFKSAGATGLTAATTPLALLPGDATAAPADGTPEQIHLTWGDDPSSSVFISWASPAQAINPRVELRRTSTVDTIRAIQRTYTDGLNGQTVFTYHARLDALTPGSTFHYSVTADNDRNRRQPFAAEFRTAPGGRVPSPDAET